MPKIIFLLLLLSIFNGTSSYKILVSVPKFAYSHMKTMGGIADVLVEGGHDVTFLMPVVMPIADNGTKLAKVVIVPPSQEVVELGQKEAKAGSVANLWKHSANSKQGIMWSVEFLGQASYLNTKLMLNDANLIETMKNEKFDIGITELFDFSGLAFFNAIGLKNVMGAHTTSVFEGTLMSTGSPILSSFVPGSQSFTDDSGLLFSRLNNIYMTYWSYAFQNDILSYTQKAVNEQYGAGNAPKLWDLVKDITWFLVNSDPIFDFPKPLPHNVVEIAGISVAKTNTLDGKWNKILSKRDKNVLVSFGSVASPTTMPLDVKKSIIETFAAFPDVTFIWKFDESEAHLSSHLKNVEIVNWMPQNDLLADKRITAFWTHGGLGSLMESSMKGVPLVVVPVFGDQMRNAQIAKRHGMAIVYDKMELVNTRKLVGTIREVLENQSYKQNAILLAKILATERISPRQKILDAVRFAGEFGPMPRWTLSSKNFPIYQYYNLDIIALFATVLIGIVLFVYFLIKCSFNKLFGLSNQKTKSD